MVNAILSEMGLLYPPAVEPLPKQAKATVASANRLTIRLSDQTPSWCLLHEIAHSMTSTVEGSSDGHGAAFMGIYIQLIVRYLRLEPNELIRSLDDEGIEAALSTHPSFVDL